MTANDINQEKYKNKPWILEDETGQYQYQGPLEGSQSSTATYYLLMLHGKEFLAFPAGSWYAFAMYNFNGSSLSLCFIAYLLSHVFLLYCKSNSIQRQFKYLHNQHVYTRLQYTHTDTHM